jgi:hypothetical protein
VSKINRDITYANLEAALGRIYNSVGLDALPSEVDSHETNSLADQMQARLVGWEDENFSPRPGPIDLPVAIGEIEGVPADTVKEFRAAIARILDLTKVRMAEGDDARLRINSSVSLEPPRDGGRPARVRVALLDAQTGDVRFSSEFKTTLSEPVDEQQWRTLGEGAAYRVVGPIARLRTGRVLTHKKLSTPWGDPELKLSRTTGATAPDIAKPGMSDPEQRSLALRLSAELARPSTERMSKIELDEGRRAQ